MSVTRSRVVASALGAILVLTACSESPTETMADEHVISAEKAGPRPAVASSSAAAQILDLMTEANSTLEARRAGYRVAMAEYITRADAHEAGLTVFAKDVGNRRLTFDFVPNDPRRPWSGEPGGTTDDITYAVDQTGDAVPPFGGLDAAATDAAIVRAMGQWDALTCSDLGLVRNDDFGLDIGAVADEIGTGGSPYVFADVQHAGWGDIDFDPGILAATFTFGLIDGMGRFTDANRDGYLDTAFREIYYDPSYPWADDGTADVDVETIALHEAGHGISHGHFGQVAVRQNGTLMIAPHAVMNALYAAPMRTLSGADIGGHCNSWGSWPNAH
jgi:hypothetical protein